MLLRAQHVAPPAAEVHFPCHSSCAKIFLVIMSTNGKPNCKLRKILFASVIAIICVARVYFVYQQNKAWAVPEEVKKLKNPLQPSESNLSAARELFKENCVECHGDAGKGDGPEALMHDPPPADLNPSAPPFVPSFAAFSSALAAFTCYSAAATSLRSGTTGMS